MCEDSDPINYWTDLAARKPHASDYSRQSTCDKKIIETSVLRDWVEVIKDQRKWHVSTDWLVSERPDFKLQVNGLPSAVELVELLDQEVKRTTTNGTLRYGGSEYFRRTQWTCGRFLSFLTRLFEKKNANYQNPSNPLTVDHLLIYTDEPYLSHIDVENWVSEMEFPKYSQLRHADLFFTYCPRVKSRPLLRLF